MLKYQIFIDDLKILNLSGDLNWHPFVTGILGEYMDHLKGYHRKAQMTSKKRDLTTKQKHPYWKSLKD